MNPCAELAAAVRDADFVFEAGPENLELKRRLFEEVEQAAPAHALLASNTSVIPITQIMAGLERQGRTLGTHWWNPPYLVPLVEVIQTEHTDPSAVETMTDLLRAVGKTPVTVRKDVPGFIGNRLQHAMWREAIALVERGVCDAETVDTVVKSSFGMRLAVLGPLENADLVGTDLTLAVHEHVLPDLDRTPGPLPYLKSLVEGGRLGMKNGRRVPELDRRAAGGSARRPGAAPRGAPRRTQPPRRRCPRVILTRCPRLHGSPHRTIATSASKEKTA